MKKRTPKEAVIEFRKRHDITTDKELDKLLGFSSNGRNTRLWEASGAPYYVTLLFALIDKHGINTARSLAETRVARAPRDVVLAFRDRHGLSSEEMDKLFGLGSKGRATRRWIDPLENGAPAPMTVMMTYVDNFGPGVLEEMTRELAPARSH